MNRRSLYMLYAALWVFTGWLFYVVRPQGAGPLPTLFLYGPPVFILYLFSLFFLDVRDDPVDKTLVLHFLKHRQMSIVLFFFALVLLILLIFS